MSTKIHNGYKLVDISTMNELFEFCGNIASQMREIQGEEIRKLMGLYLSMEFDLACAAKRDLVDAEARPLRIDDEQGTVIDQVIDRVAHRIHKAAQGNVRDPEFDMSADIAIFPPQKSQDGEFIPVMLFTERQAFAEKWRLSDQVKDFHFQTQEGRPENISEAEWDFRREVWSKLLPHGQTPAESALTYKLCHMLTPFSVIGQKGEILDAVPDYDTRLRNMTRLIASHEKSVELMGDRSPEDFSVQERIKMSMQIAGWLRDNEDEVGAKTETVKEFLVEEITLDRALLPTNQAT